MGVWRPGGQHTRRCGGSSESGANLSGMPRLEQLLLTYLQLARASEAPGPAGWCTTSCCCWPASRRILELDWDEISATCRERILQHNPRHLVRRYARSGQRGRVRMVSVARCEAPRASIRRNGPRRWPSCEIEPGDEAPRTGQSVRELATELVQAVVRGVEPAAARTAQQFGCSVVRAGRCAPVAGWWPFWLALAAWLALAVLLVLGGGRIGWS